MNVISEMFCLIGGLLGVGLNGWVWIELGEMQLHHLVQEPAIKYNCMLSINNPIFSSIEKGLL